MNIQRESTELKKMILQQWIDEGMTREDAIALFKEISAFV